MSLVECLARAVPFQKWRKNGMYSEGEREKVQGLTENVLSHKKAQKSQNEEPGQDCKEGVPEINI
jgi:hypothetical protein